MFRESAPTQAHIRIITVVTAIIRILEDYVKCEKTLAIRIHVKITVPAVKKTTVHGTDVNASTLIKAQTAPAKQTHARRTLVRIQEYV